MNEREKTLDEVLATLRANYDPFDYPAVHGYQQAIKDVEQMKREGGAI